MWCLSQGSRTHVQTLSLIGGRRPPSHPQMPHRHIGAGGWRCRTMAIVAITAATLNTETPTCSILPLPLWLQSSANIQMCFVFIPKCSHPCLHSLCKNVQNTTVQSVCCFNLRPGKQSSRPFRCSRDKPTLPASLKVILSKLFNIFKTRSAYSQNGG